MDYRLAAVHLFDCHLRSEPGKYTNVLLLSLTTMMHLKLLHINILSEMDLVESYGELVQDLSYLQQYLDQDPRTKNSPMQCVL